MLIYPEEIISLDVTLTHVGGNPYTPGLGGNDAHARESKQSGRVAQALCMRGDTVDEGPLAASQRFGPVLTVATAFFLAELGDKRRWRRSPLSAGSTISQVPESAVPLGWSSPIV